MRVLSLFLAFAGLSVASNIYTLIPITEELSNLFGVSEPIAALASTLFSVFYAIGFLIFGPLSDHAGRKKVMTYGMFGLTVITFAISFIDDIGLFLVFRSLQGFMAASFAPVALTYIFDLFSSPKKRQTSIALISTGLLMAGIVGQVLSLFITNLWGWSYVFTLFAVIYLLIGLFMYRIPDTPRPDQVSNLLAIWKQIPILLKEKSLLKIYFMTLTMLLSFVGMYSAVNPYLMGLFHLDNTEVLFFRAVGIIGILPSLFTGFFSRKIGLKATLITALSVAISGLLFERMFSNVTLMSTASIFFVAGIFTAAPTLLNLVGMFADRQRSMAISLFTFILFMGASLGPMIATLGDFKMVSLFLALLLGVSAFTALTLKDVRISKIEEK